MALGDARVVEDEAVAGVVADDHQVMRHRPASVLEVRAKARVVRVAKAVCADTDDQRPAQGELLLHGQTGGGHHLVGPAHVLFRHRADLVNLQVDCRLPGRDLVDAPVGGLGVDLACRVVAP